MQIQWRKWVKKLYQLDQVSLDRCFKPVNSGRFVKSALHHFSDASEYGYRQVSYGLLATLVEFIVALLLSRHVLFH